MIKSSQILRTFLGVALGLAVTGCSSKPADDGAAPERNGASEESSGATALETPSRFTGEAPSAEARILEPEAISAMPAAPMNAPAPVPPSLQMEAESFEPKMAAAAPQPPEEAFAASAQAMRSEPAPLSASALQHEGPEHLRQLPEGSTHDAENGFATVQVFYATDRSQNPLPLSAYEVSGEKQLFFLLGGAALLLASFGMYSFARGTRGVAKLSVAAAAIVGIMTIGVISTGQAAIEKHGVTYNGDRGHLVRGICNVTVPDKHERGVVERPSLLRFEFKEDQREHIVMTSAVELNDEQFRERLAQTVDASAHRDLLVFIHGYNVGFEAAVRRTAQIAVDLPFDGVPVCYSWPSQGTLLGYPVDENNVAWTVSHLKQFLREIVEQSGADSVNLVAHSMGNRAMTAALQQMRFEQRPTESGSDGGASLFDRVVLAAPDVDADLFRRDLAPALVDLAKQVTLYASSDDQALIASKTVHGYPRAGESGASIVVVPGIETIDVSGIDLSLLGHSYYGDSESMLRDLYNVLYTRLPASQRTALVVRPYGELHYWQLMHEPSRMR